MADNQHLQSGGAEGSQQRARSPAPPSSTGTTAVQTFSPAQISNTSNVAPSDVHARLAQISQLMAITQGLVNSAMSSSGYNPSQLGTTPSATSFVPPGYLPQNQIQWTQSQNTQTQINTSNANAGLTNRPDKRRYDMLTVGDTTAEDGSGGRKRAVSAGPYTRNPMNYGSNTNQGLLTVMGPQSMQGAPASHFPQNSLLPVPLQGRVGTMPVGSNPTVPVHSNPPWSNTSHVGFSSPSNSQFAPNTFGQGVPTASSTTTAQKLPDWMRGEIDNQSKAAVKAYTAATEKTLGEISTLLAELSSQQAKFGEAQEKLSTRADDHQQVNIYFEKELQKTMLREEGSVALNILQDRIQRLEDEAKTWREKAKTGSTMTTDKTIHTEGSNPNAADQDLRDLDSLFGDGTHGDV